MEHVVTAKLFMNGRSQAVRLPKEFRFEGDEVIIFRRGDRVILQSKKKSKGGHWDDFFFNTPLIDADFMKGVKDAPPQGRGIF